MKRATALVKVEFIYDVDHPNVTTPMDDQGLVDYLSGLLLSHMTGAAVSGLTVDVVASVAE